jgi:transposase InsO family protein
MLVDNFSRFILSYRISAKLCAEFTLETIREAYSKMEESANITLLVDGGSENNNQTVRDYLAQPAVNIEKQVAMLNIHFSNSMIESIFKLLKYRYLYFKELETEQALRNELDWAVKDYNDIRPHGSLNGLTPKEVQNGNGIEKLPFKNQLEQARKQRLEENRSNICNDCE